MIKNKEYPLDCIIKSTNEKPVIIITYDENTFLANDGIQKI